MEPVKGKEKRYWVALFVGPHGCGKRELREVPKAHPVTIAGWEHLDLFASRLTWYETGVKLGTWRVCEGTTGTAIGPAARTRAEAVQMAKDALAQHGKGWIGEALEEVSNKYGLTPRYTD